MIIEDKVKERIVSLITEAQSLSRGNSHGQRLSEDHSSQCKGWLASAAHMMNLVCGESTSAYKNEFQKILDSNWGFAIPNAVGAGKSILEGVVTDIDLGLLSSITDMARAETFDNFLDHAKHYQKNGDKREAGVISGVVFEDSIRRVCDKNDIEQKGVKLDELISKLTKQGTISQTKAKRARVAAHVRTKATHAQWDEFEISDVGATIKFTEELIENHIDC